MNGMQFMYKFNNLARAKMIDGNGDLFYNYALDAIVSVESKIMGYRKYRTKFELYKLFRLHIDSCKNRN